MRLLNTNQCIKTFTRERNPTKGNLFHCGFSIKMGVESINHLHMKIITSETKLILPMLCPLRNPLGKANRIFKYCQQSLTGENTNTQHAHSLTIFQLKCWLLFNTHRLPFFSFSLSYKLSGCQALIKSKKCCTYYPPTHLSLWNFRYHHFEIIIKSKKLHQEMSRLQYPVQII